MVCRLSWYLARDVAGPKNIQAGALDGRVIGGCARWALCRSALGPRTVLQDIEVDEDQCGFVQVCVQSQEEDTAVTHDKA